MREKIHISLRGLLARIARNVLQASLVLVLFFGGWTDVEQGTLSWDQRAHLEREQKCLVSLVWHEARGEGAKGRRAVLDVVHSRAQVRGWSYCRTVAEPSQFPWYKRKGLVELTDDTLATYNAAFEHRAVLTDEKHLWFYSGPRPSWAKRMWCEKLGRHTFCRERT